MARQTKKPMSEQDKVEWDNLYQYVRFNILGYDKNQSLSKKMVLRLRGLSFNKYMDNNNIDDTANYSFVVILNTFKYCSVDIQNAIKTHNFKDEEYKFNYILKIVESKLNTVYIRMKQSEKAKKEIQSADISRVNRYKNNFVAAPTKEHKKNYDNLW